MTRNLFFAVACGIALVVAAMVSILARDVVPVAPFAAKPLSNNALVGPSANTDGKRDRLPVDAPALRPSADPAQGEPLRQAYAADSPFIESSPPIAGPVPMPRARNTVRPPVQKNYTLLSDTQIAAIRGRLKLTSAQEAYWPNVETALRAIAKVMHDRRQSSPGAVPQFEADSAEVEQLKTAAMPLIAQLREDQKREVRALARIIGLEAVASQI